MIKAVKAGDWELVDGAPVAAGVTLQEGEYELKLVAADAENSAPLPAGGGVVVLDTAVTPELAAEGLARDVIRVVQQARRDAGPGRLGPDRADRRRRAGGRGGGRGAPGLRRRGDAGHVAGRSDGRDRASPVRSATANRYGGGRPGRRDERRRPGHSPIRGECPGRRAETTRLPAAVR